MLIWTFEVVDENENFREDVGKTFEVIEWTTKHVRFPYSGLGLGLKEVICLPRI